MKAALKYAALALGPIVLIVGIWWTMNQGGTPNTASRIDYVNVVTGERTSIPAEKAAVAVRPDDSGEWVLFPVAEDESGEVVLVGHYRGRFDTLVRQREDAGAGLAVDPNTYQLR
jgi:hypothetical protein